jgi:hypothetical protein
MNRSISKLLDAKEQMRLAEKNYALAVLELVKLHSPTARSPFIEFSHLTSGSVPTAACSAIITGYRARFISNYI